MSGDVETQTSIIKKATRSQGIPFSNAALKNFVSRHVVRKDTRVSQEALDLLNRVFDEVGGWIVREAEKMVATAGRATINADHVRSAAKLYLSWEEEK